MAKLTFFSVLISNLKCAFCRNKVCSVRYMPQRRIYKSYDGTRYVTRCRKDKMKKYYNPLYARRCR